MSKPFIFKQFTINQDRCAMKIGTDGVLLGAWASVDHNPYSILDIGAGTGIIALMLAQRSAADNIEAIELDADAYEQCTDNFEASDWADRLFCFHAGFDEFVDEYATDETEEDELYDLIVSNPPFYAEEVTSGNEARDNARQNTSLPFNELVSGVAKLLTANGRFATIIPYKEEEKFIKLAENFKLYPLKVTRVKGNAKAEVKRSLLEFQKTPSTNLEIKQLVIEEDRHIYTQDYIDLTKDFYLKM
ncbi:tRNA1(Val) (adenine(37)-N6)-methyltransferase [Cellulophaga omnivescoria]|uniref:tRNA1(Val) (adenine(37)-N6)-methyltransferase n=1 Tax=Cellulophaga omnivescoria TaxID=1888890 RepID=UPI000985B8D2|nr:methyltransferase [Cellulophaga omnivescoria]WBU87888.1 methyltransferase [Cellulophaga omnivescoria]